MLGQKNFNSLPLMLLTLLFTTTITLFAQKVNERPNLQGLSSNEKIEVLNQLASTFRDDSVELSIQYYIQANEIATKLGEAEIIISQAEKLGDIYTEIGRYDQALDFYNIALYHCKRNELGARLSTIYRLIGNVYYYTGEFDKCLESHMESLKHAELNNDEGGIAAAYNNIGLINMKYERYDIALESFLKAEKMFAKFENHTNQGMAIINIGNIYYFKEEYDNALGSYQRSYKIFQRTNVSKDIALAAQNISAIYDLKGDEENALRYANEALTLFQKTNNTWGIIHLAQNIGYIYLAKNDFDKASYYFHLSHDNTVNTNSLPLLINSNSALQQLYSKKGDYEKAYFYLKEQYSFMDSLYRKETTEKLTELETKYKLEQKEKENTILKRYFLYISILSGLIVIILLFSYRIKAKTTQQLREKNLKIQQQNQDLESINATKNKFFSIIAHDLKNPLAAFVGFMEILQQRIIDMTKEEQQENLRQVTLLAESMLNLLENLLKWGRSQVGSLEFSPTLLSLKKLVDESINVATWNAKAKGISIDNKVVDTITIIADENMLATVIRNFLTNAIKFTPQGGKIIVYSLQKANEVSLFVEDNGIGIPAEDQQKLFRIDSKFRSLGTANEPGTGLGLILCKEFVERNGGTIHVKSQPGKGSTFGFTIVQQKV